MSKTDTEERQDKLTVLVQEERDIRKGNFLEGSRKSKREVKSISLLKQASNR